MVGLKKMLHSCLRAHLGVCGGKNAAHIQATQALRETYFTYVHYNSSKRYGKNTGKVGIATVTEAPPLPDRAHQSGFPTPTLPGGYFAPVPGFLSYLGAGGRDP